MNEKEFASPGRRYGGVTLWMLNDILEPDELRRQIREFEAAGWGAVITRTFFGLRTQYLSDEWHDLVRLIIDECRNVGLKVWLQAGYMPAGVPELPPGDAHKVLERVERGGEPPSGAEVLTEGETAVYTADVRSHVLDLLAPEACKRYVEESYTRTLADNYADEFGKTVETVWVDEPHFQPPSLPWSDRLPGRFRDLWGYDIVDELPAVFGDAGDSFKVRHHYWRTVQTMFLESYFTEVQRWCESHGLKFSGHLMGEDTLQAQISWTAGCMPCYEHMGLPGIDHLTRSRYWPAELPFIMTPKQCSSAANQLGKREILAEVYAVSSQGLTFQDRKRIAEWMMMLGINYRCYHGSFYSMRGQRKRIYAPHLSYQQPWWPQNRHIAEYFSRLSYLLREGTYEADALVLHPLETAFGRYDATSVENPYERVREPANVRAITEALASLSENLLRAHANFEYGDETLMAKHGSVETADSGSPKLRIGGMAYPVVILPGVETIRETTLTLLAEFLDSGGTVYAAGEVPTRVDGVVDARAAELGGRMTAVGNTPRELAAALSAATAGRPDAVSVRLSGKRSEELWLHRRIVDGGRLLLVHSPHADETIRATLTVDARGAFERWDPSTGTVGEPMGTVSGNETLAEIDVAPEGTVILLFREGVSARPPKATPSRPERTALTGPFQVTRGDPNALYLDFCRFRRGSDELSELLPLVAVQEILVDEDYHGPISLEFSATISDLPATASVAVEDGHEAEVLVNGEPAVFSGDSWYRERAFRTAPVREALVTGANTIELRRDFQPPSLPKFRLGGLFHRSTGVELEAIALVGDFAVSGARSPRPQQERAVRYAPEFVVVTETGVCVGDLIADGYSFYAGTVTLSTTAELSEPPDGRRAYLTLGSLDAAVAAVRVNGTDVGAIGWRPLELDITEAIRSGTNRVEIDVVSTLRNLLGPHHRPSGEPSQVWREGWTGLSSPRRRDTDLVAGKDWYEHRNRDDVFWTDDYFFVPFGISDAAIETR